MLNINYKARGMIMSRIQNFGKMIKNSWSMTGFIGIFLHCLMCGYLMNGIMLIPAFGMEQIPPPSFISTFGKINKKLLLPIIDTTNAQQIITNKTYFDKTVIPIIQETISQFDALSPSRKAHYDSVIIPQLRAALEAITQEQIMTIKNSILTNQTKMAMLFFQRYGEEVKKSQTPPCTIPGAPVVKLPTL